MSGWSYLPARINVTAESVAHGRGTVVDGWLGGPGGTALGGQPVEVLTAPDDGLGAFRRDAVVKTAADGSWRAAIPPGPSRLVEAVYGGDGSNQPTISSQVRTSVPASLSMRISPRQVDWGSEIVISGRLRGGYIPSSRTAVSQLLRLRIGIRGISETIGIPDVRRDGRFHVTYCFNPGRGTDRFWFAVSTLYETDYPFAPAGSGPVRGDGGTRERGRPC